MNILELKRKALGYTFRNDGGGDGIGGEGTGYGEGTSAASGIGNPGEAAAAQQPGRASS